MQDEDTKRKLEILASDAINKGVHDQFAEEFLCAKTPGEEFSELLTGFVSEAKKRGLHLDLSELKVVSSSEWRSISKNIDISSLNSYERNLKLYASGQHSTFLDFCTNPKYAKNQSLVPRDKDTIAQIGLFLGIGAKDTDVLIKSSGHSGFNILDPVDFIMQFFLDYYKKDQKSTFYVRIDSCHKAVQYALGKLSEIEDYCEYEEEKKASVLIKNKLDASFEEIFDPDVLVDLIEEESKKEDSFRKELKKLKSVDTLYSFLDKNISQMSIFRKRMYLYNRLFVLTRDYYERNLYNMDLPLSRLPKIERLDRNSRAISGKEVRKFYSVGNKDKAYKASIEAVKAVWCKGNFESARDIPRGAGRTVEFLLEGRKYVKSGNGGYREYSSSNPTSYYKFALSTGREDEIFCSYKGTCGLDGSFDDNLAPELIIAYAMIYRDQLLDKWVDDAKKAGDTRDRAILRMEFSQNNLSIPFIILTIARDIELYIGKKAFVKSGRYDKKGFHLLIGERESGERNVRNDNRLRNALIFPYDDFDDLDCELKNEFRPVRKM